MQSSNKDYPVAHMLEDKNPEVTTTDNSVFKLRQAWPEKETINAYETSFNDDSTSPDSSSKSIESRAHWSTTPNGRILAQLNAYVHKTIISKRDVGGMKDFFHDYCHYFEDTNMIDSYTQEFSSRQYDIYRKYEKKVEEALVSFSVIFR